MLGAVLVIIHGLLAVLLIGAVVHQAIVVWRPERRLAGGFLNRVASVRGETYTNAVVALYTVTTVLGGYIYPIYILNVKRGLADAGLSSAIGVFEIKEHFAVIGLAILPSYWWVWKKTPLQTQQQTRQIVTTLLAGIVVWNFLIGHVLNNLKGLT